MKEGFVTISAAVDKEFLANYDAKCKDLDMGKSVVLRAALRHFLELSDDEQWKIVRGDADKAKCKELIKERIKLKKRIFDLDHELKELKFPVPTEK